MAAASSIARWLLNEASSGTNPTTVADDQGSNDLTIDYSSGDANWTSTTGGNGLDFTATAGTAATAIAELADIANNGNIGSSLDGVTEASLILRVRVDDSASSGSRLFFIGSNSGDGDFAIVFSNTNLQVRWDEEADGNTVTIPKINTEVTIGVSVDTTEATASDRIKLYIDGVLETGLGGTFPNQNVSLGNVNSSGRSVCIGNRPSQNRNIDGPSFYAELFTGILTASEHSDAHTALVLDNDSNWQAPSGNTITASQSEAGDTQSAALNGIIQISAAQNEAGDTQAANLDVLVQVSSNQTEAGDSQTASVVGVVSTDITANQAEAGDTQAANLNNVIQISSNQNEAGDSQASDLAVVVQINANQGEAGDTQAASMVGVLTSTITANQTEAGDTQTANINNVVQISANQAEAGDTQAASVSNVIKITANQNEAGDTQTASLVSEITSTITANQAEAGDAQNATLNNIVQIFSNQLEAGDIQLASMVGDFVAARHIMKIKTEIRTMSVKQENRIMGVGN